MIKNRDIHKASNGKNCLIILSLILLLLLLSSIAFAIPNSLTLQGKLTNLAGASQAGAFNFSFKIYDAYTGGNKLYESKINLTTDANGIYDAVLQNLSILNFSDQYYLGIMVGSEAEMEPRINLTSTPYSFRANVSEALNRENRYEIAVLNITGNLTLGDGFDDVLSVTTGRLNISDGNIISGGNLTLADRITFRFSQIIDNLVNGFLRISGNLNVTGNVSIAQDTLFVDNTSGKVGIGTVNPVEKFVVIGNANISGTLNASGRVSFPNLASCNTLDTDANGVLSCGTDAVSGDTAAWNRGNNSDYLGGTDVNASLIKIGNMSTLFSENIFKRANVSEYLGGTDVNASLLKFGNISNILKDAFTRGNVSEYLGGTDVNASLLKSTNATFLGLFAK